MRIVLGVTGGIAAYKACTLLRLLTEEGHDVTVVPTASALKFVGAPTWAALSGKAVSTDVFDQVEQVRHVRLGQEADLVIVAPATADFLARSAQGLAPDLLGNVLLTATCPVVFAPAMHTEMWRHPATRANVALLRERGVLVIEPAVGRLTGKDSGPGRLPEPEEIRDAALAALDTAGGTRSDGHGGEDLAGRHLLITAGGTREPLDPVRYLGNRSSGKQGVALAAEALRRGARVTLIAANVSLPPPPGAELVTVETAVELQSAVEAALGGSSVDAVIMAAAVADFRPASYASSKIKKSHQPGEEESAPTIELVRNPDILAGLVESRGRATRPLLVGFAAETGDAQGSVLDHARAKLMRKGCDLIVANQVGKDLTFGADSSTIHILDRTHAEPVLSVGPVSKAETARAILDAVAERIVG